MRAYKPSTPFNVPMILLVPTRENKAGIVKKEFPETGLPFFGSFRTFGGTERTVNGVTAVENTATIETWYRPDITSGCRVKVVETGRIYEMLGEPENIYMRNQFLRFKVTAVRGGA